MSSPSDGHGGSSSSVDELFENDESTDVADRAGLIHRNYHAPAVHVLLSGGMVAVMAGVVACADAVVDGSSLDRFDIEPLFWLLLPFRCTSSSGGGERYFLAG